MIPKIIHYCWFGGGELPEQDRANIETWKRLCPDYEIRCWNETNYDVRKNIYMREAYEAGKLGFVPDYARLDIIYKYGGFYFDTDVELIKPLDTLLGENCVMGFESKDAINHGHGFAAVAGNSLIKDLRDTYDNRHFINPDGSLNLTASPAYISDFMEQKGVVMNNLEQVVQGVHVFPSDYFCPKNMVTGVIQITGNTYSIHHFNMSWLDERKKKMLSTIKVLSRFLGKTVAYNLVEFVYNVPELGFSESVKVVYGKVKKRSKKK